MSRAKLWEDTIVIALRDMQWLAKIDYIRKQQFNNGSISSVDVERHYVVPPGLAKMDGKAESKIGDVVAKATNDRFFIFEVKSTAAHINTEWRVDDSSNSKLAYRRLKKKIDEVNKDYAEKAGSLVKSHVSNGKNLYDKTINDEDYIKMSLRGHYFAYWTAESRQRIALGRVGLEPYILAASRCRNAMELTDGSLLDAPLPTYMLRNMNSSERFDFFPIDCLKSILICRFPRVLKKDDKDSGDDKNVAIFEEEVGLTRDEMIKYLKFLCDDGSGKLAEDCAEQVHMVILSKYGFMKVITDTNDLLWFIDGNFRNEPTKKVKYVIDRESPTPSHPDR